MESMLDHLIPDERAMNVLRDNLPVAYGMAMSGDVESLSLTFAELAASPWFHCPAPMVRKTIELLSVLKADLE